MRYIRNSHTAHQLRDLAHVYNAEDFEAVYIPCNTLSLSLIRKNIGYILKGDVWHWVTPIEAANTMSFVDIRTRHDGTQYISTYEISGRFASIYCNGNVTLYSKICAGMKEGDSLKQLKERVRTVKIADKQSRLPAGVQRFITKIEKPMIARYTDNPNKKSFDYITVDCYVLQNFDGDRMAYVKEHIKEINEMVLDKISNNISFKKFDVPVNILKATSITLRGTILTYRFEIKGAEKTVCLE